MGQVQAARLILSCVSEWRSGGFAEDWEKTRRAVLERDGFSCFYCGFASKKYMHVHHLGGRYYDDSEENLVTLCPFCHACLHVGHAGIKKLGRLLLLEREADQAKMNRYLLEDTALRRDMSVFSEVVKKLPVEKDFGSSGLVELANMILHGEIEPDGRFLFFPDPLKFDIVRYLIKGAYHDAKGNHTQDGF